MFEDSPIRTAVRRHARALTWRLRAVLAALTVVGLVALGGALARGGEERAAAPIGPRAVAGLDWDVPEPSETTEAPPATAAPTTEPSHSPEATPARRPEPKPHPTPTPEPSPTPGPALRPGERIGLEPATLPGYRVRHRQFAGRIDRIGAGSAALERADSTFTVRAGLAGSGCVSFEAVNYPGFYLRHQDFALQLHRRDASRLFTADATFCPVAGLAGRGVSLRSFNYPDRYVVHQRSRLYIAAVRGGSAGAATFGVISGLP